MKYSPQEIDLYEAGNAPKVKNVKVGDVIRIKEEESDDNSKLVNWTVQQVYPYFVYATSGSRHKCFNYGMLVQLGLEE